jgi:phage protein D
MPDDTVFADAYFEVGGRNQKQHVRSLRLVMEQNAHELAVVTVRRGDYDSSSIFNTGSPVRLVWGYQARLEQAMVGYCVNPHPHYHRRNTTASLQDTDVTVLGASLQLKQVFSKSWEKTTVDQMVRELAGSVMFSTDIDNASMLYPQYSNPGQSGWKMLRRLGEDTGNFVYARNTHLYFFDAATIIRRKGGTSPTFHTQKVQNPASIITFEADGNSDFLTCEGREKANRYLYGIEPKTVEMFLAGSNPGSFPTGRLARQVTEPIVDKLETGANASDAGWAQTLVDGAAKRNRYNIRAWARLNGDPRVAPSTGVILRGLGDKHSGLWIVLKVTHNLSSQKYTMDVELGRDSTVGTGSIVSFGRRVVRPRLDPFARVISLDPPPSILSNGVWRSAWGPTKAAVNA